MIFPTCRFHRDGREVLVTNAVELDALGPEWADTPAAFLEPEAPRRMAVEELDEAEAAEEAEHEADKAAKRDYRSRKKAK